MKPSATAASESARRAISDYVRLTGAELSTSGPSFDEHQVRVMAEILLAQRERAQNKRPPYPSPNSLPAITP